MTRSSKAHLVPLSRLLRRSKEKVAIDDGRDYKQVTVRLWNKGVCLRREVRGSEIKTKRQFVVRAGQLLLSRIDLRNGAIGLVPEDLTGAVVSGDFWSYDLVADLVDGRYLELYASLPSFVEQAGFASTGTTNRIRADERSFLEIEVPLPPLDEQRRIVARIEAVVGRVEEARRWRRENAQSVQALLTSLFSRISRDAPRRAFGEVAPLVRRPVKVMSGYLYPELGIRSFGKGTFHKPALSTEELGSKRVFHIEPGDLVFSNVFAWEGAVAVAREPDRGRIGSHRFITCVPNPDIVTANFLCFYFLTTDGLKQLGAASPGGAGRNRTLGLNALAALEVPVPSLDEQLWFDRLCEKAAVSKAIEIEADRAIEKIVATETNRLFLR